MHTTHVMHVSYLYVHAGIYRLRTPRPAKRILLCSPMNVQPRDYRVSLPSGPLHLNCVDREVLNLATGNCFLLSSFPSFSMRIHHINANFAKYIFNNDYFFHRFDLRNFPILLKKKCSFARFLFRLPFNEIVREIIIHIESFKFIFLIDIESERYLRNKWFIVVSPFLGWVFARREYRQIVILLKLHGPRRGVTTTGV